MPNAATIKAAVKMLLAKGVGQKPEMSFGVRNRPEGPALAMQPWGVWNHKDRICTTHPSKVLRIKKGKGRITTTFGTKEPLP